MTINNLPKEVHEQWCRPGVGATRSSGTCRAPRAALVAPTPSLKGMNFIPNLV
jgi:hypothetical protein